MPNSNLAEFLVTPAFPVIAGIVLIALAALLVVGRKKLKPWQMAVIGVVILLCVIYLAFVTWLSVGFGSGGPASEPVPR